MKTVIKGKKSIISKKELDEAADYCANHPVFEESNRAAAKALSSLDRVALPESLKKLLKK